MRFLCRLGALIATLVFLAATSARAQIVVLSPQARTVFGYSTSGLYDPYNLYTIGATPYAASLNPLYPTELPLGGTANFLNVLKAAFPVASGWSFAASPTSLVGSLLVHTYDVQGTPARVGAEFDVEYLPTGTDPTASVHWIQVVTDNHNLTNNPGHGNNENIVDNPFSPGKRAPYYDDGGAADGINFYDFPWRGDAAQSHNWYAELFLVTGPAANAPGRVTIYNGVGWGWTNNAVPEPGDWALMVTGGFIGALALRRRRRKVVTNP